MKHKQKKTSWIDKKLKSPKFRKAFHEEYVKLALGEQLLRVRLHAGMTQAQVAEKVGTTASAISRYENAEYDRYELKTIRKIVEACGAKLEITVVKADKGEVA